METEKAIEEVIEKLNLKAITSSAEASDYPNCIVMKKDLKVLLKELEKKDKLIDLMAKHIEDEITDDICCKENCYANEYINGHCPKCLNCIKQYFEKKANEEAE